MEWMLVVMLWANVLHPLPEEAWARSAYSEFWTTFESYAGCIEAKDKVLTSLNALERVTVACVPRN